MKKFVSFLSSILFFTLSVIAQKDGTIRGVLMDSTSRQPLENATVTLLDDKDSSLVGFSRTNSSGYFILQNLATGKYRLLFTHIGYRNLNKRFLISDAIKQIDFGTIVITHQSTELGEVTVLQEKAPVTIKNDTIEYNAGSFKTKPNAVVEDLLKKLPGIQVGKDGKIKANGEDVKKVLVDGKEFFGNDPKVATKNLPSDAIDKVQVFDRKSDQSRFTGFDDGNSEKTINLTIKPDKKNGVFGKETMGAGDKGRYQGNFNINSFSGERQFSAIGMANNTNKQGFSFMDILNFSGGLPGLGGGGGGSMQMDLNGPLLPLQGGNNNQGITTTWAGGLNYNNNWQKKIDFMSSYFYNRLQTEKDEQIRQQWFLPGNNFTALKRNTAGNSNQNHRLNVSSDYKIDSMNSIKLSSSLNLQKSAYRSSSVYRSEDESSRVLNDGFSSSFMEGKGYSSNNDVLFRHRFGKKGRTFSASVIINLNNTDNEGWLMSQNNFYRPDGSFQHRDTINQVNAQHSSNNSYGTIFSYTEPFSKRSLLEINYIFNTTQSRSNKNTFDLDTFSRKHTILNETLSNKFSSEYTFHRPGINWRYQHLNYNFAIGLSLQQAALNSDFHLMAKDSSLQRTFVNLLPNANFQYNINKYKNIRLFYNTFTRQPSIADLQPVEDNSDPLNVKKGNPDLKQEFNHRLQANYMSFDPFRQTSFFIRISLRATSNKIVNADLLAAQGQRITQPVNANGIYSVSANSAWGFPIRKLKSSINLNTSLTNNHTTAFINAQRNDINTWEASQEITWNYSFKDILDLSASANVGFNAAAYSLQHSQNLAYWNQNYTFDMNIYLPLGFSVASDVDYSTRSGLSQGYNATVFLWNAGLAKQLFKNKKGEARIQVFDILNQNKGINRTTNPNFIEDASYNVLRRFAQVSFTYKISRFAGKSIGAPGRRNDDIKVISM